VGADDGEKKKGKRSSALLLWVKAVEKEEKGKGISIAGREEEFMRLYSKNMLGGTPSFPQKKEATCGICKRGMRVRHKKGKKESEGAEIPFRQQKGKEREPKSMNIQVRQERVIRSWGGKGEKKKQEPQSASLGPAEKEEDRIFSRRKKSP